MTILPDPYFVELASAYLDASLTATQEAELLRLLEDPRRRQRFLALLHVDREIAGLLAGPVPDEVMIDLVMNDLAGIDALPATLPAFSGAATPTSFGAPLPRSRWPWRRSLAAAAAALLIFAGWSGRVLFEWKAAPPVVATLTAVTGEVFIQGREGRIPASAGTVMRLGEGIVTGGGQSLAVIEYPDATRLELGPATVLTSLAESSGAPHVQLQQGLLSVEAAEKSKDKAMVLVTPQAEAIVSFPSVPNADSSPGARLILESEEEGTQVQVVKGQVRFKRRLDDKAIDVHPGNFAVATPTFDAFVAQPLPPEPAVPPLTINVNQGARLGHKGGVASLAFSGDGKTLLSATWSSGAVRLWDLSGGRPTGPVEVAGHAGAIWSAAFSPDRERFATGGVDQTVRLVRRADREPLAVLAHRDHIRAVAFSRDGRWLATGGFDSILRLRDPHTGQERFALPENDRGGWAGVYALAFSPDSQLIATGLSDRRVRLRQTSTGKTLWTLEGHTEAVRSAAFSPDGRLLVSASSQEVILRDVGTREILYTRSYAGPAAYSPDGRWLALGGAVPVLLEAGGGQVRVRIQGHRGPVYAVAFSQDGKRLALGGWLGVTLLDLPPLDGP